MKRIISLMLAVFILLLAFIGVKNLVTLKNEINIPSSGIERTFAFIKPDAVAAHNSGKILDLIEHNAFDIIRMQKVALTKNQAEQFYAVHKDRPFFKDLVTYMTSGPAIALVLQKDNAVQAWRDLMGATNPAVAQEGTIRKLYGTDITHNATHGSDSKENALQEMRQFFNDL